MALLYSVPTHATLQPQGTHPVSIMLSFRQFSILAAHSHYAARAARLGKLLGKVGLWADKLPPIKAARPRGALLEGLFGCTLRLGAAGFLRTRAT